MLEFFWYHALKLENLLFVILQFFKKMYDMRHRLIYLAMLNLLFRIYLVHNKLRKYALKLLYYRISNMRPFLHILRNHNFF